MPTATKKKVTASVAQLKKTPGRALEATVSLSRGLSDDKARGLKAQLVEMYKQGLFPNKYGLPYCLRAQDGEGQVLSTGKTHARVFDAQDPEKFITVKPALSWNNLTYVFQKYPALQKMVRTLKKAGLVENAEDFMEVVKETFATFAEDPENRIECPSISLLDKLHLTVWVPEEAAEAVEEDNKARKRG